ncbi:protein FAR1-RELATED SEQUENCE 9-like [Salvia hispanica]|uniref:protein FAR1-RELATED SEQUENCE 9-like n=1 Tax=Salvia hispanica TaxID=49212 RepID=UPI002009A036|nr:protein FAR1-RELATED SEQUENCE 9-like [Salvia hispanica]
MEEGGSSTMDETYDSNMDEVVVVPECSKDLKPVVGQKFKSLDFCFAEGSKKSSEDDQANARSGFSIKRRRLSKRCGCKASISFKFFSEGGVSGYTVEEFNEVHNHYMLVGCNVGDIRNASRDIKAYAHGFDVQMVLDDMARKKEMSEAFTYEYEVNASNQLVALFWCDGLMKRNYHMFGDIVAFDTTYNTNRYCMIFAPFTGKDNHGRLVTFAAGLVSNEKTDAFAWLFRHFFQCMGVAPKMIVTDQDLGMRSAIDEILVGTRHRWCMWHIMHKLANTFPGRLLRDEDFKKEFNACVWSDLLEPDEFEEEWNGVVERYGLEEHSWFKTLYEYRQLWIPVHATTLRNFVEFYLNFNQAVDFQRNSRTKLDYQDATALPILATNLPFEKHASTLYTDSMFKKIQEEIVEGNDRCRVLGFSSTDSVDTYKLGDSLRHSYFVRHDRTDDSYSCDCKLFSRKGYLCSHDFSLFRNNEVKKIPDNYCASRWMKTPLTKAVHGHVDETLPTQSVVDERQNVSKQGISLFYGFLRRFETDIDVLRAFVGGPEELGNSLQLGTPLTFASEKRRMIEQFYGMERPEVVEVHPPDVVKTKGLASSSASHLISKREKAIKDATRPLRRCKACDELCHHDSRNCPMLKELETENELRKGKRKC